MDTVTILRLLWRLRLGVVLAAAIALFVGCLIPFQFSPPFSLKSRKYEVGVATARILVDTPASQVVDVSPKGSDVLGGRATLLANLMVDGEIKTAIARRAGLPPDKLLGSTDKGTVTSVSATQPNPRGFQLQTSVLATPEGDSLPIIVVNVQAPDAAGAQRLANASVSGLQEYLASRAAADRVPDAQRLRISAIGVAQGHVAIRGPRLVFGVVAAIFLFLLSCSGIVAMAALVQALRAPAPRAFAGRGRGSAEDAGESWGGNVEVLVPRAAAEAGRPVPDRPVAPSGRRSTEPERAGSWWGGGPA